MTSKYTEPPGTVAGLIATQNTAKKSAAMPGSETQSATTHSAATPKALRQLASHNLQPCAPWQLAQLMQQLEQQKKTNKLSQSGVQPGCSVLLLELEDQQSSWFKLAKADQPEPQDAGLISLLSPLGLALLGKQSGDLVVVRLFGRQLRFQLLDIIRVQHKPGRVLTTKTAL
jgi:transcription elongation GreA/GreB family factor